MDYKIVLFALMNLVFFSYVFYVWIQHGIKTSISFSYYFLNEKYRDLIFLLFCWGFSIPAMILGESGWLFFAGGLICFVGIASDYATKELIKVLDPNGNTIEVERTTKDLSYKIHMMGSYGGVLLSQLAVLFTFGLWQINILFVLFTVGAKIFKMPNATWWIEVAALLSISGVLYTTLT